MSIAPAPLEPPLILVADNDECAREVHSLTLRRAGFRVIEIVTVDALLWSARLRIPAAIVVDVAMDDLRGWSALQTLASEEATSHIPVIVVSTQSAAEGGLRTGAAAYLFKPVSGTELLGALDAAGVRCAAAAAPRVA